MQITPEDIRIYRLFRRDPLAFIEKMWGLVPQPVKPQFETLVKSVPLSEFSPEWFMPFEKGKHLTWQQWVFFLAIKRALEGKAPKRISIRSGHGIGKTGALAMFIHWFLFCFKDAQIPCTAPTSEQMYDILWKELAVWRGRMPKKYGELYQWQSNHYRIVESPETWFARAATARKENPEALAGVHGDHVAFVIDEASGVPDVVFSTGEGALTNSDIFFIMISNGTRLVGYFYESHNSDKANWQCFSFNSEESPLVDWSFVDRIEQKYGKESDEYRVKVQGLFPKEDAVDEEGYVPLFSRDMFHFIEGDQKFIGLTKMGIDASGAGKDKTEWYMRDNFQTKSALTEDVSTPKSISQKTIGLMDYYGIPAHLIWLDNFGEGANVGQQLAYSGYMINAVSFGDNADDKTRYANKRAEMYWRMREWMMLGGRIENDPELVEQLLSIRYKRSMVGNKIELMSKEKMKKKGFKSPDKPDAIALTFYQSEKVVEEPDYERKPSARGWKYKVRVIKHGQRGI